MELEERNRWLGWTNVYGVLTSIFVVPLKAITPAEIIVDEDVEAFRARQEITD